MKNLFFILTHIIFIPFISNSQSLVSDQLVTEQLIKMPSRTDVLDSDFDGSPYLDDSFQLGTIFIGDHPGVTCPMRYDIYQDVMEVKYKGRLMQIIPSELIRFISINKDRLVPKKYPMGSGMIQGLLFELDTGKINLYKKRNLEFEPWRAARAQESGPKKARFKDMLDSYFIEFPNQKIVLIEKAKDITLLFHDHRKEIDEYLVKNKLKMKDVKLIEFIRFYNTLQ